MHWLIKCRSKPNTDALREATLPAHRDFLDGYPKVTWYSGPIFTDDNKNAIGSLRLIEFADRAAATDYINADPYIRAGIFQSIAIERWAPGLNVRQRDYQRKTNTTQFVIHAHDKPGSDAHRPSLLDAHIAYLQQHANIIVARGLLVDDAGGYAIGQVMLVDVANKSEAAAFWADEPLNRAGIYAWSTMQRWRFGHV